MIKNWQQAEQTISSGKQVLDMMLRTYVNEKGVMLGAVSIFSLLEYGIDGWGHNITEFIPEQFTQLAQEVARDMKQAKEYLGLDTKMEDNLL